jgi:hypothetical protein
LKPEYKVQLTGRVCKGDAKLEYAGDRPLVKFTLMIGTGKRKGSDEYQKPYFENIKIWGKRYAGIKKGDDLTVVGLKKRDEYQDKQTGEWKSFDFVEVKTTEQGDPVLGFDVNWAGDSQAQRGGLTDEQIAAGKGKSIQVKRNEEIEPPF